MARSIAGTNSYIQRETTPGTAKVDAMIHSDALRLRPGWDSDNQMYRGGSGKNVTGMDIDLARTPTSVDGINCFNAIGLALASRVCRPTTTTPVSATDTRLHVGRINPNGEDTKAVYTHVWGDATQATQNVFNVFQSLSISVQRGNLTFNTKMHGRAATTGATLPSTGILEMSQLIIPGRQFNVYLDDAWDDLGTTKALACYEAGLDLGDKFDEDAPIDRTLSGFKELLEKEEQDQTGSFRLGFDSVAVANFNKWTAGSYVFMRLECIHPVAIEDTFFPTLILDASLLITKPGEIGKAPNSPAVTVPFDAVQAVDPVSGEIFAYSLQNAWLGY